MLIELVQDETHAIHETIHVGGLAFGVSRPTVRGKRRLKSLKILHPFQGKVVWLDIGLVKDEDEWQFRFV